MDYAINGTILAGIADAIRSKTHETGDILPGDMTDAIMGLEPDILHSDMSFLPYSDQNDVLLSAELPARITKAIVGATVVPDNSLCNSPYGSYIAVDLANANTDVTCYCVAKRIGTSSGELLVMGVPYNLASSNDPCFDFFNADGRIDYTSYGNNSTVYAFNSLSYHCFAISVNTSTKTATFYIDGNELPIAKVFSNSGSYVCFGRGARDSSSYDGNANFLYVGAVQAAESGSVIYGNAVTIMTKLGLTS